MRRIFVTILGFIFGASLPIYAMFFWEPNDDLEVMEEVGDYIEEHSLDSDDSSVAVISNVNFFKVNPEEIKQSMTKEEIEELKSIIIKLSAIDIMKIDESSEKNDVLTHTKFVIETIKTRLSDSDYNNFEKILGKYIDFSSVNTGI